MAVRQPRYSKEEFAQRGDALYELVRTQDWSELIRAFGGREAFIRRYFKVRAKPSQKAKPPKKGSRSRS